MTLLNLLKRSCRSRSSSDVTPRSVRLGMDWLESRVMPAPVSMAIDNQTALPSTQYTVWVTGFSAVANVYLASDGTFQDASALSEIPFYPVSSLSNVNFSYRGGLPGGALWFVVTPAGQSPTPLERSPGSVKAPPVPPFKDNQSNVEYVNDIVEFTIDSDQTLHIDTTQVTQFVIPSSLLALDTNGQIIEQVGVTYGNTAVNRQAIGAAYTAFMTSEGVANAYGQLLIEYPAKSIAGQYYSILSPTSFISIDHTLNPLDTYWDSTLATLFDFNAPRALSIIHKGVEYTGQAVDGSQTPAGSPAIKLTGGGHDYYIYDPRSAYATTQGGPQFNGPQAFQVFGNVGVFTDRSAESIPAGGDVAVGLHLQQMVVTAINRGVALSAPTSGAPGFTSTYWGTAANWYQPGNVYNVYSKFFHEATVGGVPLMIDGRAYGFGYDEDSPVPNQPKVTPKYDPLPTGTTSLKLILTAWLPSSPSTGGGSSGGGDTSPGGSSSPGNVVTHNYAVGAGEGGGGTVTEYRLDGTSSHTYDPFPGTTGGTRPVVGDFNDDGTPDVAVGTGPGAVAHVKVFDGKTGSVIFDLQPFENFTGGVFVAAGDINGDGQDDLVISPDLSGGPRVRVVSGNGFTPMADFYAIDDPNFRGGARAGVGDVNGDGFADLVASAGFGGGPRLAIYDGKSLSNGQQVKPVQDFFLFEQQLRNGAYVAVGDVNGDGFADIVGGAGPGGGPRVLVVSGQNLLNAGSVSAINAPLANFFAGDTSNRGGVRVVARDLDGDQKADVVTGSGAGVPSNVRRYSGAAFLANPTEPALGDSFDPFGGSFANGVYVG